MKIILEKADVVRILAAHFDTALDDMNVVIRPDPLEIEVTNIQMHDSAAKKPPPKVTEAGVETRPDSAEDMGAVLRENERLLRADRNTLRSVPQDTTEEMS